MPTDTILFFLNTFPVNLSFRYLGICLFYYIFIYLFIYIFCYVNSN